MNRRSLFRLLCLSPLAALLGKQVAKPKPKAPVDIHELADALWEQWGGKEGLANEVQRQYQSCDSTSKLHLLQRLVDSLAKIHEAKGLA